MTATMNVRDIYHDYNLIVPLKLSEAVTKGQIVRYDVGATDALQGDSISLLDTDDSNANDFYAGVALGSGSVGEFIPVLLRGYLVVSLTGENVSPSSSMHELFTDSTAGNVTLTGAASNIRIARFIHNTETTRWSSYDNTNIESVFYFGVRN